MVKNHLRRRSVLNYLAILPFPAHADIPNTGSIRILSPYPPGASVDFWVRQLESWLKTELSINTSVIYAPGGSGLIAARQLKNSSSSTLTIMLASMSLFVQMPKISQSGLDFDPNYEFIPLAILWDEPYFMVTRSDSPIESLKYLTERKKSENTPRNFGTTGLSSSGGILIEYISKRNNLPWNQIPFKGMSEIITSLRGGHIDIGLVSYQPIAHLVESGLLRVIATTSKARSIKQTHVPSLYEAGLIDFDGGVWFGLFISKHLDTTHHSMIRTEIENFLKNSRVRNLARDNGFNILGLTEKNAQDFMEKSNRTWSKIITGT